MTTIEQVKQARAICERISKIGSGRFAGKEQQDNFNKLLRAAKELDQRLYRSGHASTDIAGSLTNFKNFITGKLNFGPLVAIAEEIEEFLKPSAEVKVIDCGKQ